jgi:hypothetical protein
LIEIKSRVIAIRFPIYWIASIYRSKYLRCCKMICSTRQKVKPVLTYKPALKSHVNSSLCVRTNPHAQLSVTEIGIWCAPDAQDEALLRQKLTHLDLSARAYHRVLKVARTIADLAGSKSILTQHIAEAVLYRRMYKQAKQTHQNLPQKKEVGKVKN